MPEKPTTGQDREPTEGAPGQDKTYEIKKADTGETKTVTQRQWREEKLGQAGWEKVSPDFPPDDHDL